MALPNDVSEFDPKYHHLVGKHILKYAAEPNDLCQNTSKAASLFSYPRIGKDIENRYLFEHFEHVEPGYAWPRTILNGSGAKKTFKNRGEFKHTQEESLFFTVDSPHALYIRST